MVFDYHSYQKKLVKFSCPWEKGRQCFETRWYTDTTAYKTSTFYNFRNGHCFSINHRSVLDLVRPYEVYRFDFAQVSVPKDVCLQICLCLSLKRFRITNKSYYTAQPNFIWNTDKSTIDQHSVWGFSSVCLPKAVCQENSTHHNIARFTGQRGRWRPELKSHAVHVY